MTTTVHFDDLASLIGTPLGATEWMTISQDRINTFADATGDPQWIHVDPERAKTGPFGTTIATATSPCRSSSRSSSTCSTSKA